MKCNACSEVVPPKFAHSIKKNECPFCGGEIMDPALQSVLSNLQDIMKAAEPYLAEVEEWFASNYSLRKVKQRETGPGTIPHPHLPSGGILDDEEVDEEIMRRQVEAAKTTATFQKRAGVKGMDAKSLIEKIQGGKGAADPSEFVGEDEFYGKIDMSEETNTPLTEKEVSTMIQAMNQEISSEDDNDPVKNYYELEKLKKLQRTLPSGKGKFSREQ
jgi:hypothetical protein